MKALVISPTNNFFGETNIPGDKSISHRAIIFASMACGKSKIKNLLEGHDCLATIDIMRKLGVHIALNKDIWEVNGQGLNGLKEPSYVLDCKNSGTTMRLISGLLSGLPFFSVLDGSEQIKSRPMDRVIFPLRQMGAKIFGRQNNMLAPMAILPSKLNGFEHNLLVKSAQVKSALILAGLLAKSKTIISNISKTRDHSEILLKQMGADIQKSDDQIIITPLKSDLSPLNINIPGDISSAAFLMVAALGLSEKPVVLKSIGINPTRTGIIDALLKMGGKIYLKNQQVCAGEQIADIWVEKSKLTGASFGGEIIVRMIDEIPILAVAAAMAHGTTIIKNAEELKVKESNRLYAITSELKKMGANIEITHDGLIINGPSKLIGSELTSFGDHRIALSLAIAGLIAKKKSKINFSEVISDSFPGFTSVVNNLGGDLREINFA